MFTFLNSVVIPLLLASAIPLLIYLFNRRKVRTIPFSSLRFLKMLESQRIRHVRLFQILLILVRTLFILFLVLSFSRPAIMKVFSGGGSSARATAVLLLDDSYSMQISQGNENSYDRAQKYLAEILKSFKDDDQVFILSASADSGLVKPVEISAPDLAKKFPVKNYSPALCTVFRKAGKIFTEHPNVNKEFYFISDFKIPQSVCRDSLIKNVFSEEIKIFLARAGSTQEIQNIGIDTAYVVSQFYEIKKPLTIKVVLHNYSAQETATTAVHLFGANKRLAAQNPEIQAAQSKEVLLNFVPEKAGYQLLHIEIDDDDLLADNRYYLSLNLTEKIKILAVNTTPLPALQSALQILNAKTAAQIEYTTFSAWQGKNFAAYDIILINDLPNMNAALTSRLQTFLDNNKSIILIPGDILTSKATPAGSLLSGRTIFGNLQSAAQAGGYFALDDNFLQKSLFRSVFEKKQARPALPEIYKYYKLSVAGETIISLRNGDPFLQHYSGGKNGKNLYVFASALSREWTKLPLSGVFVPLLQRLFFRAAQTETEQRPLITGEDFNLFLPDISQHQRYVLNQPNAEPFPVIPKQAEAGLFFDIKTLAEPGHYSLLEDGKTKHVFAVNLSSGELRPPFMDFTKIFPEALNFSKPEEIKDKIMQSREGSELWLIFLILAFLMLVSEMLLIRKIEGKVAGRN